jgi:hypothetical protein
MACVATAAPLEAGAPPVSASARCPSPSPHAVVRTVSLPGRPGFLLLKGQSLWVAIAGPGPGRPGKLARVDAGTGHVQKLIRLPTNPYRVAYAFGSLWVTGEATPSTRRYAGAVLRLDPRTGRILRVIRAPILLGSAITATRDAVWVGGGDVYPKGHPNEAGVRFVFRIDPRRNAVVQRVRLRSTTVIDLLAEGNSLWATGWGAVVKLSSRGRVVYQRRFYGAGWSLARSPNAVWVAQPFSGTREPRTQRPARRLLQATIRPPRLAVNELSAPPGLLSSAGGVVWMPGPGGLVRIDAARDPVTLEPIPVGTVPNHVAAFKGGVWGTVPQKRRLVEVCWSEMSRMAH